jgi:hypothetical protein
MSNKEPPVPNSEIKTRKSHFRREVAVKRLREWGAEASETGFTMQDWTRAVFALAAVLAGALVILGLAYWLVAGH